MSLQKQRQKPKPKVLLGADIEVFLKDKETNEVVSAEGIVKGSKEAPFAFKDGGFATSLDNIMVEFNIPPASTPDSFAENIDIALDYVRKSIPENLDILIMPAARVDRKWLQTENALLFGCDPDYNAWTMGDINPRPDATTDLRSCGGHIHLGYPKHDVMMNMGIIRAMDIHIGLASILQEPDNERKQLYGRAGAFRNKKYGVEYRTPSNYYISKPELTKWVFNNAMAAYEFAAAQTPLTREEGDAIQLAINGNDKQLAQTLCTYFGVKLA